MSEPKHRGVLLTPDLVEIIERMAADSRRSFAGQVKYLLWSAIDSPATVHVVRNDRSVVLDPKAAIESIERAIKGQ